MSKTIIEINQSKAIEALRKWADSYNANRENEGKQITSINPSAINSLLNIYDAVFELPDLMEVENWIEYLMEMLRAYVGQSTDEGEQASIMRENVYRTHLLIKTFMLIFQDVRTFQESTKQHS